jgi:tripartite-type tricarboxylate transporter receptor subunit TctC
LDVLPDIPTMRDFVRGYEATTWFGLGVPKNTPVEIAHKLHDEINVGLADAGLKMRFAALGDTVFASSLPDVAKLIVEDTEQWGKVIRAANIKAE